MLTITLFILSIIEMLHSIVMYFFEHPGIFFGGLLIIFAVMCLIRYLENQQIEKCKEIIEQYE